ncbi:hypothetical protein [Luteolibacter sp. Populi]|uniref:hypothetical protein n=1 Tax=Luteolibacter sp. Populi TaxID=3230487 RepID=UPI003466304F
MIFPNLGSITGSASPGYYLTLSGNYGTAVMSLPALTTITKPADGDIYRNSSINLAVGGGATISAPLLSTFKDNDPNPDSSLGASGTALLDLPLLTALTGVDVNLNAASHPERLVSLSPGSALQINSGTLTMGNLVSFGELRAVTVENGAVVTFPNVTSYVQPANRNVNWNVFHNGSRMIFPNLASITGSASPGYYLTLSGNYGTAVMSLPALTTITKPADGDIYRNSSINLAVGGGATISAPLLSTFKDNDPNPDSSLGASGTAVLDLPLLTALTGVDVNLNAASHPERLVSLSPGSALQINSGTLTMGNLVSFGELRAVTVENGAVVTFPNVTSYVQPANRNVNWNVFHNGSQLIFPNLGSITGSASPGYYLTLSGNYGTAVMSLPVLTTITKPADGDIYRNSSINLVAGGGATIFAPLLGSFRDNDPNPGSSISASGGGQVQVNQLVDLVGVAMDFGSAFTIPAGQNFIGYGTIQYGVFNSGLIGITSPDKTLQINGPLVSTGTVKITNGGSLVIDGSLSLNDAALLVLSSSGRLSVTGDFTGTTKNTGGADPAGTLLMNGARSSLNPQILEAMSRDLGTAAEGFSGNNVFGTLALGNNTNVKLVDNARNTTSNFAECLYANSVIIPTGCMLNLNGLHLYARAVQLGGTVTNGTIIQIPDSGEIALGTPVPGKLAVAGELDEWSFTARAGRAVSIMLNPGPTGAPAPVLPHLAWANVQLVDSTGGVVTSGFSTVQGERVILADINIPADGSYRIRVNAPAAHTVATGNYILGVWDSTPNVRSLTLGQKVVGSIGGSFAVDQWTFSALEGQQIQLRPQLPVPAGIVFTLKGPAGYIGFQDLAGDSALINLPASGNYTLHVRGLEGTAGAYGFSVNQTSLTTLALNAPYAGTWAGTGDARLFKVELPENTPLDIALSNVAGGGHSELYARHGAPPTRETYDHAAKSAGSTQRILVPSAKAGIWYLLAYCESAPAGAKGFVLKASSGEVFLTQNSTSQSVANASTTLVLTGAGFTPGSTVSLVAANGSVYPAASSSTDLPTRITATFAANSLPPGTYSIVVTQPGGATAQLPSSLKINPAGEGILRTRITVPNPIGNHISATIYVHYTNEGVAPMPAPVLNVYGTTVTGQKGAFLSLDPSLITAGFWTSAAPLGYSDSVQILASGETPGVLQPGESRTVPVYYVGWRSDQWGGGRYDFHVNPTHADSSAPVDYSTLEAATKPAAVPAEAWHIVYANLLSQLGTTAGGYVRLLDQNAAYLGQLGKNETDISKLWSFAVTQAYNTLPNEAVGGTTDQALPIPGKLSLAFGRTFRNSIPGRFIDGPLGLGWVTPWQRSLAIAPDGRITISTGGGDQAVYLPDSRYQGRYFSVPGDQATLVAVAGGYRHTTLEGIQTYFLANGQLNYLQDPAGNRITATFTADKLTKLTASSGQFLSLAYNAAGRISQLTNSATETTTYTYDAANSHLLAVTGTDGRVTTYSYQTTAGSAALHALTSIAPPGGTVMSLAYDTKGRLASVSANGGLIPQTLFLHRRLREHHGRRGGRHEALLRRGRPAGQGGRCHRQSGLLQL